MTFQSDRKEHRTFDEDRGWELELLSLEDRAKFFRFRLLGRGGFIYFGAELEAVLSLGTRDSTGQPLSKKLWRVLFLKSEGVALLTSDQKRLVEDALAAFGMNFNGPSGPIVVKYDDENMQRGE